MAKLIWNGDKIYQRVARPAARGATKKTTTDIVREVKLRAPVGVTGNLRRSFTIGDTQEQGSKISTPAGFVGSQDSAFRYAMAVEKGRRPGKAPPPGTLDLWVRRKIKPKPKPLSARSRKYGIRRSKLDRQEQAIRSVAFLIGRKIKKYGIPARPFIRPAFDRISPYVLPEFKARFNKLLASVVPHK